MPPPELLELVVALLFKTLTINSSKILEECLSKITEEERYLIIQHYILCRSNNDIALEYGLNESSSRRRIANIIKKMK